MSKILSCAVVVALLVASSSSVFARGGASALSPAAQFKTGVSPLQPVPTLSGPASYAPGQQMRNHMPAPNGVTPPAHGASVWAPGFLK